jgi:hypothetical protein
MQLNLCVLRRLEAARRPGVLPTTQASVFLTPGPARRAPVATEHELARLPRPTDLACLVAGAPPSPSRPRQKRKGARWPAASEPWEGGARTEAWGGWALRPHSHRGGARGGDELAGCRRGSCRAAATPAHSISAGVRSLGRNWALHLCGKEGDECGRR